MARIYGLGGLNIPDGLNKLVAVKNSDHYVFNSSTLAWTAQNQFVQFGDKVEFIPYLNKLFAVNRLNATRSYNGVTWEITGGDVDKAPRGAYGIEHNERLYIADIILHGAGDIFRSGIWFCDLPDKKNHITWDFEQGTCTMTAGSPIITSSGSKFRTRNIKIGDPFVITGANGGEYEVSSIDSETQITLTENLTVGGTASFWVGGNFLIYKTNNSDYIRGVGKNSGKLLFYKRNSVGRSDGLNEIVDIKGIPGTTSHRSIVNLREWTFWYHPTGIWRTNGVGGVIVSNPIWDYIEGVDSSNYPNIVAWSENERYLKVALGDVTNTDRDISRPDCVAVLDILDNQWSFEQKGFTPTAFTTYEESNQLNNYAGGDDGNVYQMDTGTSWDGEDMPFEADLGVVFPVSPEVLVDFNRILAYADPSLGLSAKFKIHYKENGRSDLDWQDFQHNQESFGGNQMIELQFPTGTTGTGVELLLLESGQVKSHLFERATIFWDNPRLAEGIINAEQRSY